MAANVEIIRAFLDGVREKREGEEFERLMLNAPDRLDAMERCNCILDELDAGDLVRRDGLSALTTLRANLALERLQARYPKLWAQAEMITGSASG